MILLTYRHAMVTWVTSPSIVVVLAVLLDACVGEPSRFHPLVGFGNIATKIDRLLFTKSFFNQSALFQRACGVVAVIICVVPFVMLAQFISAAFGTIAHVVFLYLAIGAKSLVEHCEQIRAALASGDVDLARRRLAMIVSRNTDQLEPQDIARAAIESILENGSDAIFGAIFWFVLLGPAGAVLFRLSNTLDAMWGYKTEKYLHFGWAAARLDDVLCWVPARLTALSYAMVGDTIAALKCWRYQARTWYSPNAGPVMASGAGALYVVLGGAASYHGVRKERPVLGLGNIPDVVDIGRALSLVRRSMILWLVLIVLGDICLHAQSWR